MLAVEYQLSPFRSAEAQDFIRSRIAFLSSLTNSFAVNVSLTTCHHLLGSDLQSTTAAIRYALLARQNPSMDKEEVKELEWLIEILQRQKLVEEAKERRKKEMGPCPLVKLVPPQYSKVSY